METMQREDAPRGSHYSIWLHLSAWVFIIGAALNQFSLVTADPDLWGHIRFGEEIWRLKGLEHVDPYAYTTAGTPWINHEWLTEILFYAIYSSTGDAGLLSVKFVISMVVVLIMGRIARLREMHPIAFAVVTVPAIAAIAPGFMIRPQVATYLMFALYLLILHLYFSGRKKQVAWLPVLMVAWVNLHGGFLMGIVFLGGVVAWEVAYQIRIKGGLVPVAPLGIAFFTTFLASFVNPYGYKLHLFLYQSLKIGRAISEWEPVALLDGSFLAFKLLLAAFVLVLLILRRKALGWETAGLVLLLYAALKHQRHIPFFAMMVCPYLIYWGSRAGKALQTRHPRARLSRVSAAIISGALVLMGGHQAMAGGHSYIQSGGRIIVDTDVYPVAAVRFMRKNHFTGNLQLPFEWGEYAIWKLYPACRVSIDGRFRTTYPEVVIQDHFKSRRDPRRLLQLADKYGADIILAHQNSRIHATIKRWPSKWRYVYSDAVAAIYVRNSDRNRSLLEAFRDGDFIYPQTAPSPFFP